MAWWNQLTVWAAGLRWHVNSFSKVVYMCIESYLPGVSGSYWQLYERVLIPEDYKSRLSTNQPPLLGDNGRQYQPMEGFVSLSVVPRYFIFSS